MLWIKSFHIVFVITWFAALFYLPRLFVYHADTEDHAGRERFEIMERKLYRGIMTPSAILATGFGLWLVWLTPGWLGQGWFHAKMALVIGLIVYHLYCGRLVKRFRQDRNRHSARWYRVFNELPVLVLVGTVLLVELKPF